MSVSDFKRITSDENKYHRENFRDNFTWIEDWSKKKYGKGNYFDHLAMSYDFISENIIEIKNVISKEYIKSHSYKFNISPTLKDATDSLRKSFIDNSIQTNYNKNQSRALLALLQQIRDNLTHYGKFEITDIQYKRNAFLVKNASIITDRIVEKLESD